MVALNQSRLGVVIVEQSLRYSVPSELSHSVELFGPRRNSPGMDIGWELPLRSLGLRRICLHITQCLVACLESLNGGTWPLLFGRQDTRITRMPCQHLKVCCAQCLSAILKNTFTMADRLSVPAWLTVTVEELSWCHSVLASELGKYVF